MKISLWWKYALLFQGFPTPSIHRYENNTVLLLYCQPHSINIASTKGRGVNKMPNLNTHLHKNEWTKWYDGCFASSKWTEKLYWFFPKDYPRPLYESLCQYLILVFFLFPLFRDTLQSLWIKYSNILTEIWVGESKETEWRMKKKKNQFNSFIFRNSLKKKQNKSMNEKKENEKNLYE